MALGGIETHVKITAAVREKSLLRYWLDAGLSVVQY